MSLPSVLVVHMEDTGRSAFCSEDLASEDGFSKVLNVGLILIVFPYIS